MYDMYQEVHVNDPVLSPYNQDTRALQPDRTSWVLENAAGYGNALSRGGMNSWYPDMQTTNTHPASLTIVGEVLKHCLELVLEVILHVQLAQTVK